MRAAGAKKKVTRDKRAESRQVNIRVQPILYEALEAVARHDRRSLPQVVRQLLEDGLRLRADAHTTPDDTAGREIGRASCRERVEMSGGGGVIKKKKEEQMRVGAHR